MKRVMRIISIILAALLILPGCADSQRTRTEEATTAQRETVTAPAETTEQATTEAPAVHTVSYDAESKTLRVSGTGGYEALEIPEEAKEAENVLVEDDEFTLILVLTMSYWTGKTRDVMTLEELPKFLSNTEKSLRFIRAFMTEHSANEELQKLAGKKVELNVGTEGFGYENDGRKIVLNLNYGTWYREYFYALSLLPSMNRGWEQIGFASLLGWGLDPHGELWDLMPDYSDVPYAQICKNAGLDVEHVSEEDFRTLSDACSSYAIEKGLSNWDNGTGSAALITDRFQKRRGSGDWYVGDQKMSTFMAVSFVAWLCEKYGYETVEAFVLEEKNFTESFGTEFTEVFEQWQAWIVDTYPFVENPEESASEKEEK